MKKNIQYLYLTFLISILIGCVTIQTNIDNRDDYYEIPIESRRRFLIYFDYIMGNYTIKDRQGIQEFKGNAGKILTYELTFYENNIKISIIEIIQREIKNYIFITIRRFVKFTDKNGRSIEYEIKSIRENNYFTILDENIGTIEINYYMTNGVHTGFDIIVNNERYGIIAFYPDPFKGGFTKPSLFLMRGNELNRDMAMYIMMTYLNYNTNF
jgi:hypothetical protein